MKKVQKKNNLLKISLQVNSRTETRTQIPCGISHQLSHPGNILCFHHWVPTTLRAHHGKLSLHECFHSDKFLVTCNSSVLHPSYVSTFCFWFVSKWPIFLSVYICYPSSVCQSLHNSQSANQVFRLFLEAGMWTRPWSESFGTGDYCSHL